MYFRESLLKTAKVLVDDTKNLVAGAASNHETLAEVAEASVKTITSLAECVKRGAASLGANQQDAQVRLSLAQVRQSPAQVRLSHAQVRQSPAQVRQSPA